MRCATGVVQEDVKTCATGRTEASSCYPLVQVGFGQHSQKAAISERMRSTDLQGLYRALKHNNKRNSYSVSADERTKRFINVTAERDGLFLRLSQLSKVLQNFQEANRLKKTLF